MNVAESTTDTSRSLRGIRSAAMFTRNTIAMLTIRVTPRRKLSDLGIGRMLDGTSRPLVSAAFPTLRPPK